MAEPDRDDPTTALWRAVLTGSDPSMARMRRALRLVPSSPRCKVCGAPFGGPGRVFTRLLMGGRATTNPFVCTSCFGSLRQHPGGAEIELSVLFADVRGSTGLAERIGAGAYTELLHRFYGLAARVIDRNDGVLDKFLGDGVMALFLPMLGGDGHAGHAIQAGRDLIAGMSPGDLAEPGLRIGAGVHTGLAFAGAIGSEDRIDFSALGDTVNVAARLGSLAGPGQLLVSSTAWRRGGMPPATSATRTVEIAGRAEPLEVVDGLEAVVA